MMSCRRDGNSLPIPRQCEGFVGLFPVRMLDADAYHATGTGGCTRYELAFGIVSTIGQQAPVHPMTTAETGWRAARPSYSILENFVLKQSRIMLPHWRDSLVQFVKSLTATAAA